MDPLRIYQHWNPGKLIFGPKSLNELAIEIPCSEIPLIVTDKGISNAGILKKVGDVLEKASIPYHLYDGIEPDPSIEIIEKAAAIYRQKGCMSVIGLGGGSSIDTAKAVSLMVTQQGTLREFGAGKAIEASVAPIYAIPTTAGTGS